MLSLLLHAAAGVAVTAAAFWLNAHLYRGAWPGKRPSALEVAYYLFAVTSVCAGWYFNVKYVLVEFPEESSWIHYIKMLFTNAAASSGAQDLIITNTFLFPMWLVSDGPRRGIKAPFIFFVMSLFTSFAFSMALYLAAQERQVRFNQAAGRG